MTRIAGFLYGLVAYLIFFVTFLYAIGFVENLVVPKSVDVGGVVSTLPEALIVNVLLLGVFAVQHSLMARPEFKKLWTKIVPKSIERSTYVLKSSLLLLVLYWLWIPIPAVIWNVSIPGLRAAIWGLFWFGWLLALVSTFLINHFDLFGLRQVWLHLRGKPYTAVPFRSPWLYRQVRHPLYVGWFMIFWATPTMTVAHLVFALMTTGYILVAIQFEERDLMDEHPEYREYRKQVPMIVPFIKRAARVTGKVAG